MTEKQEKVELVGGPLSGAFARFRGSHYRCTTHHSHVIPEKGVFTQYSCQQTHYYFWHPLDEGFYIGVYHSTDTVWLNQLGEEVHFTSPVYRKMADDFSKYWSEFCSKGNLSDEETPAR